MSETRIEHQILIYLNSLEVGFFWKNITGGFFDGRSYRKQASPFAINGVSDIIGVLKDGNAVFIEVKDDTGRVSEAQKVFLKKVESLGAVVGVARSVDEARNILLLAGIVVEEWNHARAILKLHCD